MYEKELIKRTDFPWYNELSCLREVFADAEDGVAGLCWLAARLVHDVGGLEDIAGYYWHPLAREGVPHAWNYDRERGLYVDITHDQFVEGVPIAIFEESTPLLRYCKKRTEKQRNVYITDVYAERIFRLMLERMQSL